MRRSAGEPSCGDQDRVDLGDGCRGQLSIPGNEVPEHASAFPHHAGPAGLLSSLARLGTSYVFGDPDR